MHLDEFHGGSKASLGLLFLQTTNLPPRLTGQSRPQFINFSSSRRDPHSLIWSEYFKPSQRVKTRLKWLEVKMGTFLIQILSISSTFDRLNIHWNLLDQEDPSNAAQLWRLWNPCSVSMKSQTSCTHISKCSSLWLDLPCQWRHPVK